MLDRRLLTPASTIPASLARLASLSLSVAALLSVFVAFYAFLHGRWVWGAVALLAVGAFLMCRRLSSEHQLSVVLIAGFSGFALLAAEGVLSLSDDDECSARPPAVAIQCAAAHRLGLPFDMRYASQVRRSLQETSRETVWPSLSWRVARREDYKDGDLVPVSGISNALTLFCNESGSWVSYRSDEHGFRNPIGSFVQSSDDTVVLIGDSFTQGYCVSDGETIAGYLRATARPVLNLGIGGNGPLAELASLKEFGTGSAQLGPVVWFYYEGNDLTDLEDEKKISVLGRYLVEPAMQRLRERQAEVDSVLSATQTEEINNPPTSIQTQPAQNAQNRLKDFVLLRRLRSRLEDLLRPAATPSIPVDLAFFEQVLREAKRTTDANNRPFAFVYLPEYSRFAGYGFSPHRESVIEAVSRLNIPIIDITDAFGSTKDPLALFPNRASGHYNPAGYALVASRVDEWLEGLARQP